MLKFKKVWLIIGTSTALVSTIFAITSCSNTLEKQDTVGSINLKKDINVKDIVPSTITSENALNYFDYTLGGDIVKGATYKLVPSWS